MKNILGILTLSILLGVSFIAGSAWTQSQEGTETARTKGIHSIPLETESSSKVTSKLNADEKRTISLFKDAAPSVV